MLARNQLNGVYGLPKKWATSPTNEGCEEIQEEERKEGEEAQTRIILPFLVNG